MNSNPHSLSSKLSVFLISVFFILSIKSNAQNNCNAMTLEAFFDCYGGKQSFSTQYVDALTAFITAEDAINEGDYSRAKTILDGLWNQYPIGNSVWNSAWQSQLETNIGSPYGYYGLRMMDDIVNYRLANPQDDPDAVTAKMKIVLVGCMQGTQPRTQQELDNGGGEFVTRFIDKSLRSSDYRIVRQSIDLFAKYITAITRGKLNLDIDFIELPDLCLETNISAFSSGVYDARPNLGPVWEVIDEDTFNETDWWMVISPSAVPIGGDFEDDEFITGGMGVDNKGGPLFIADDSWLVRKPYHLGEGAYSDIERRAYLPQWYQHEFYHHLYRIYPEFALEVNGHDWFNRSFWPNDFVGLYEPDYYAETLYKRLQTACDPLENRLITAASASNLALFSEIDISDIVGPYSLDNIGNDFHKGEIRESGNTLFWRNAAGVQWELTPRLSEGYLETGADCPYPGSDHFIELATDGNGNLTGVNSGFSFLGEFYRRRFNTFFDVIPVELTFGKYMSANSSNTRELYEQDQQYYWKDQNNNLTELTANFNQGYFNLGEGEDRLELIMYTNCNIESVLAIKDTTEVFTKSKFDERNASPQQTATIGNLEFFDNQPITIELEDYFIDPENDDLVFVSFYDEDIIDITTSGSALDITPVGNGNSRVSITVIDSNRGTATTEFEVDIEDLVLSSNEINAKNQIKLFPNPAEDRINVRGISRVFSYRIYNLMGIEMQKGFAIEQINVAGLNTGTYLLIINESSKAFLFSIVD